MNNNKIHVHYRIKITVKAELARLATLMGISMSKTIELGILELLRVEQETLEEPKK